MRRLSIVLFITLIATTLSADPWNESDPRPRFDRARHMIVGAARPLTDEDRAELLANGVEIQQPLTGGRYIARVIDPARVAGDARIASVEPMTERHKILRTAMHAAHGRAWIDVTVIFHKDVAFDAARQAILASGGALDEIFGTSFLVSRRVAARITPAMLNALAADERVLAIGGHLPMKAIPHNAVAAALSHVPEVYAAPYNLSGAGQLVMVSEISDAQSTHPEFGGRLIAAGNKQNGSHSTHVSGTIGAAGLNAPAKGMAPNVQIREFDVGQTLTSDLDVLNTQLPVLHPIANNTSLGFPVGWCDCGETAPVWLDEAEFYGSYEPDYTASFDDLTAQYGTLLVFSAGNEGTLPFFSDDLKQHFHLDDKGDPDVSKTWCISRTGSGTDCPPATCTGGCEQIIHHANTPWDTMTITGSGKNVLAVGAVQTTTTPPVVTSFSSRGPAKDGRVKPDIVARGRAMLSTVPTNSYDTMQGTSMSAPVVTGISALLAEQWQKTFGSRPAVAQLRGVILAGAQDLGNTGPDYTYGFGLIDAKASADLIRGDGAAGTQIANVTLTQGARIERNVTLTAAQNLKVLVTWPDPSVVLLGNDAFEAKALVNDLDLKVTGPDGTIYLPYVLDKVNYELAATHGVNTVDNTELIEIANAAPGIYRATITGTNVAEGPQTAVVFTNAKAANFSCTDTQEPNNSAETAFGNVPPGTWSGGICTAGDVDFFKFEATEFGLIKATVTSGDTPLRATLTGVDGTTVSVDIPANSTREVAFQYGTGNAQAPAYKVTLKLEATATLGSNPQYSFDLDYGQFNGKRRRSSRH